MLLIQNTKTACCGCLIPDTSETNRETIDTSVHKPSRTSQRTREAKGNIPGNTDKDS